MHAASHVVLLEPSGFSEASHAQAVLLQMYVGGGGAARAAGAAAGARPAKAARAIVASSTRASLSRRAGGGGGGARGGTILVGHQPCAHPVQMERVRAAERAQTRLRAGSHTGGPDREAAAADGCQTAGTR